MTIASRIVGGALASIFLVCTLNSPSWAQNKPAEARQFGSSAAKAMNEALAHTELHQYDLAISKLSEALEMDINAYERSTLYQMLGAAYYEQENYVQAMSSLEDAIEAGGLRPEESTQLRLNIAQLMIASGRNREGATLLEAYLKQGHPSKPAYVDMLVGACVQAEDYECALPWAEKWFETASPKERKHYDLLNFLYNNLGLKDKQADLIKQMIHRRPEDMTLWKRWASMLSDAGREDEAFEVNKMLYLGGALTSEADLIQVVQYYSYYDMPFQAAQILEREMNAGRVSRETKNLLQLSDLYRQAREYKRAVPILEQVAYNGSSATLYGPLSKIYYEIQQCEKVEEALKKGMGLGYDKGKAWTLIGTCYYEESARLERIDCGMTDLQKSKAPRNVMRGRAMAAFSKVPSKSPEARDAGKWRYFIKAEMQAAQKRCSFARPRAYSPMCYNNLANAYKARVFTGGKLELNDPSCMEYKDAYDKIYIVKKTGG